MARSLRLFGLLMVFQSSVMAVKLESLTVQNLGEKASITCTFNGPYRYKAFILNNPIRFVVDLEHTTSSARLPKSFESASLIKALRVGQQNNQTLRLVFDANHGVVFRRIPVNSTSSRVLKIDLINSNSNAPRQLSPIKPPVKSQPIATPIAYQKTVNPKPVAGLHIPGRTLRDVIVVLDPGHGGKDPGAIGMHRSAEKHVVLAIALKLKQLIDKQPGMRAVLTRNGDYYIGLRERMTIARRHNADIFVAIHADAFKNPLSNGASVFALSPRGATSEAARWLAEKENHSELGGVNLSGLDDQNGVIRTVLLDLSQTATISASLQMGSRVLRNLNTITTLHNSRVEQARFVVLKSPDIPSILIETGFISNAREEQNLNNPAYQTRLTQAIFNGIKGYFWDYPPHGSRAEMLAGRAGTVNG